MAEFKQLQQNPPGKQKLRLLIDDFQSLNFTRILQRE